MANFQNFQTSFSGLQSNTALQEVDKEFCRALPDKLLHRLVLARKSPDPRTSRNLSALMIALSPFIESFIRTKFNLGERAHIGGHKDRPGSVIHTCKQKFIRRVVLHDPRNDTPGAIDIDRIRPVVISLCNGTLSDQSFAGAVSLALSEHAPEALDSLVQYAIWALGTLEGQSEHRDSLLFLNDEKAISNVGNSLSHPQPEYRKDFNLCDNKPGRTFVEKHEAQCLICHERGKDTCRVGAPKQNSDGGEMNGCPLDQKISEMIHVHREGFSIAALAIITADNPLVALTGRRICGDCTNSCILHGVDTVDVPTIETHILDSVLKLTYGFEIYALLTRWNPLNFKSPLPHTDTNHLVCVAGQGPAGIGLSYELLRLGHSVLAVDALPIASVDSHYINTPISNVSDTWEDLDTRVPDGFGGVAEYGITSRWDKNYLKLVRILLARQKHYRLLSSARLGSQLKLEDLDSHGVSHTAICVGTGRPNDLEELRHVKSGVHIASDFLMHLNQGAYHKDLNSSIWIDFPLVVIGGGLTAFDAATEALIYYRRQLEKFSAQWAQLNSIQQDELIMGSPRLKVIRKYLDAPITNAVFSEIVQNSGGVTLLYRGTIKNSPAFKTNKDEISFALKSGIKIRELAAIERAQTDSTGQLTSLKIRQNMESLEISAHTALIATGINPNTHIACDLNLHRDAHGDFITNNTKGSCFIQAKTPTPMTTSQHGDVHPKYHGSVVKALASAKSGAQEIHSSLEIARDRKLNIQNIVSHYQSTITRTQTSDRGLLLTIKSPACVAQYQPGNFYKLHTQNKDMPLLPVHVSSVEKTLTFLIGSPSKNIPEFSINQRVSLMGPVGNSLDIKDETFFYTNEAWALAIANIASHATSSTICVEEPLPVSLVTLIQQLHPSARIIQQRPEEHDERFPSIGVRPQGLSENATILTLAPMQCMMKSVCGRCRVSAQSLEKPIFACESLWNMKNNVNWDIGAYAHDPDNPWNALRRIKSYAS